MFRSDWLEVWFATKAKEVRVQVRFVPPKAADKLRTEDYERQVLDVVETWSHPTGSQDELVIHPAQPGEEADVQFVRWGDDGNVLSMSSLCTRVPIEYSDFNWLEKACHRNRHGNYHPNVVDDKNPMRWLHKPIADFITSVVHEHVNSKKIEHAVGFPIVAVFINTKRMCECGYDATPVIAPSVPEDSMVPQVPQMCACSTWYSNSVVQKFFTLSASGARSVMASHAARESWEDIIFMLNPVYIWAREVMMALSPAHSNVNSLWRTLDKIVAAHNTAAKYTESIADILHLTTHMRVPSWVDDEVMKIQSDEMWGSALRSRPCVYKDDVFYPIETHDSLTCCAWNMFWNLGNYCTVSYIYEFDVFTANADHVLEETVEYKGLTPSLISVNRRITLVKHQTAAHADACDYLTTEHDRWVRACDFRNGFWGYFVRIIDSGAWSAVVEHTESHTDLKHDCQDEFISNPIRYRHWKTTMQKEDMAQYMGKKSFKFTASQITHALRAIRNRQITALDTNPSIRLLLKHKRDYDEPDLVFVWAPLPPKLNYTFGGVFENLVDHA